MPLNFLETVHYKLRALTGKNPGHEIGTGFADLAEDVDKLLYEHRFGSFARSIIITEQSRENTAYGVLTTPDEVEVVLPENGLIAVAYQATWAESVVEAARAAIFLGANQVQMAEPKKCRVQAAGMAFGETKFNVLSTSPSGLISNKSEGPYAGDVTTGQIVGIAGQGIAQEVAGGAVKEFSTGTEAVMVGAGGPCYIFANAGTYKISVQFKASSGKVTVKNRKLWAWVVA